MNSDFHTTAGFPLKAKGRLLNAEQEATEGTERDWISSKWMLRMGEESDWNR